MDYETKYKEALERAEQQLYIAECNKDEGKVWYLKYMFPELRESKDERIRKEIIAYLDVQDAISNRKDQDFKSWIAWLEKQCNIGEESYEIAENEKREFVGDGFIKCYADFQDFKEGETYWLEYVGKDNYNVRSDNLLGKTYHITPCQLYTIFKKQTWLEKQGEKGTDPRYEYLEELLAADDIYQMAVNDDMVQEAKTKVINALSKLEICKLLGLEKQGEQNFTDEVKPKFKIGDWIVYEGSGTYKVVEIHKGWYIVIDSNDKRWSVMFGGESSYHIWTINDAKDGDILTVVTDKRPRPFIFKGLLDKFHPASPVAYCGIDCGEHFIVSPEDRWWTSEKVEPAIKKISDSLFRRIHEEGYEWDGKNKKLIEIEKQSEQKSTDEVKPKFKVGDWCIDNEDGTIFQILKVLDNTYTYKTNEGKEYSCSHYSLENDAKLWSIEDAKDGDVLFHSDSASNGIFIFKEIIDRGYAKEIICYCDYDSEDHFCLGEHHTCCWADAKILHLATKEQRDILFQKMKEAGYEWDEKKKELKKIEQKHTEWSEEDEKFLNYAISLTDDAQIKNFLKSLKDRVIPTEKQEWSEEEIDLLLSNLDRNIKEFVTTDEFENEIGGRYWAIAKHAFLLGLGYSRNWKPSD